MAGETTITVIGNLTGDPELRFTPSGSAVANFTIASTPRTFDKNSNEWKDGTTLFMRCSAWRDMAENIAETMDQKGMRVIVTGRLTQRSYEKDGQTRTVMELEVDEIGPSLRYANAKVNRTQRSGQGGPQSGQHEQGTYSNQQGQQHAQQPAPQGNGGNWDNQPPANNGGWGNGPSDPPF
ncbi:single-strand DNA binding protein [Arthrobacter sp. PAMC 25486]|uniref:single-stranded DNA-binding protein n=1 Tax=Arthrobacter sp. PAMC 25486 TaxID=1494608 RepID=UPI000535D4CA|nr:single-stranded DNA-binding protein [Arthrobacter sp. PAMC 25486]AIY01183.1 single-strand DNA binding protein [Arthrobacter sp. PAMC 25486]